MTDTPSLCPHCGKKLRSNNTRGACSDCLKKPEHRGESDAPRAPKRSDVMKSFRTVASALGEDPNAILEEAASVWLEKVREAIK